MAFATVEGREAPDCPVCDDAGYVRHPEVRNGRTLDALDVCPMGCPAARAWQDAAAEIIASLGPPDRVIEPGAEEGTV